MDLELQSRYDYMFCIDLEPWGSGGPRPQHRLLEPDDAQHYLQGIFSHLLKDARWLRRFLRSLEGEWLYAEFIYIIYT